MHFRTVLFDLDGTLIDHFAAIQRCHAYTMRRLGLPAPTAAQVRAAVGAGLEAAIVKLVGPDRLAEALPIYSEYWDRTMLDYVTLMPGGRELLLQLQGQGIASAVFTNKRGDSARLICQHLGVAPLLAGVFGARDTPWLKPDRQFARAVLEKLGADAPTTLLVGDSIYDVAAALNAGLGFFGVTTGTHDAAELRAAGATAVFPDLPAIAERLKVDG